MRLCSVPVAGTDAAYGSRGEGRVGRRNPQSSASSITTTRPQRQAAEKSGVIAQYPKTPEAETAQKSTTSAATSSASIRAEGEVPPRRHAGARSREREYGVVPYQYYKKASTSGSRRLFNLAWLLQLLTRARRVELNKMGEAASLDDSVYIYQVVYSQSATTYSRLVLRSAVAAKRPHNRTERAVIRTDSAAIRDWCQGSADKQPNRLV